MKLLLGCKIYRNGQRESGSVAITFDDGPHAENTSKILTVLEKKNGRGTFFMTGENILRNKTLVREIVLRGHLIGNHTFTHCNALFTSRTKLYDELLRTKQLIESVTETNNRLFRPPYGIMTPVLLSICKALDLSVVLWNANSMDFRLNSIQAILNRLKNKIKPGSIFLFHECHFKHGEKDYSNSIAALEQVVCTVTVNKLKIVTINEMFS